MKWCLMGFKRVGHIQLENRGDIFWDHALAVPGDLLGVFHGFGFKVAR